MIEAAAAAGRRVLGFTPAGDDSALPELRSHLDSEAMPFARTRSGGLALLLAAGEPDSGQAALAITSMCAWSLAPGEGDPDPGLHYAACERVLQPGGVLAVITAGPRSRHAGCRCGRAGSRPRAADRLSYAQHIVLMHAAISQDQLAPEPSVTALVASPGGSRVYSDLLVFTKPGGAASHD